MVFFLTKLAVGLLVSSFFILIQAQAGIVEVVNKQFKDLSIKFSVTFYSYEIYKKLYFNFIIYTSHL